MADALLFLGRFSVVLVLADVVLCLFRLGSFLFPALRRIERAIHHVAEGSVADQLAYTFETSLIVEAAPDLDERVQDRSLTDGFRFFDLSVCKQPADLRLL